MEISSFSLVYLIAYLGRRVLDFLRHWYADGFLQAADWALIGLERLDKIFALKITLRNWFQPLYQDYTAIGYLWGFLFRTFRIAVGLIIYALLVTLAAVLFLAWAVLPVFIVYRIFVNP